MADLQSFFQVAFPTATESWFVLLVAVRSSGNVTVDYPLLRQISSICNQLPTMSGEQFSEEFMRVRHALELMVLYNMIVAVCITSGARTAETMYLALAMDTYLYFQSIQALLSCPRAIAIYVAARESRAWCQL